MELLKKIIVENQDFIATRNLVNREVEIPSVDNIIIFTGIRRSGKTSLLYLEAKKHPIENVLFLDFEDERLLFLKTSFDYDVIIESYHEIYPDQKPILFLDEVQGLPNWHLYVKRLYAKGYKIFLSGSNADLLSSDIATFISGRGIEILVKPFSFREYLDFKKIDYSQKSRLTQKGVLKSAFNDYLQNGGFPEVIKANEKDKRIVIKTIYSLLFYKDLIAKNNRNEILMKLIIQKLHENLGKSFSLSNMAKKINPVHSTNRQTVADYYHLLHKPFLIHDINQFRKSLLKREGEKKAFFSDNSFIKHLSVSTDYGKLLENQVFNALYNQDTDLFYYKTSNGFEVDFIYEKQSKPVLYQVSYDVSGEGTFHREIKSLIKAMEETETNTSFLITIDHKETLETGGKQIRIVPCWEWLLDHDKDDFR